MTAIEMFLFIYLAGAIIKIMLCLPHLPRVVAVISRLNGSPRGKVQLPFALMLPVLTVVVIVVCWPVALFYERERFFVMYSASSVIRSIVQAHHTD